jgi:hypothetical protein
MRTTEAKVGRRNLLKAAVGLTAAGAIGVPALVFNSSHGTPHEAVASAEPATAPTSSDYSGQPIVAYVQDASRGEVLVMSGEESVVIVDHDLVARLVGMGRA